MVDDRWPKITPERMVVWLGGETSDVVNDKIGSAFRNVKSFPLKRIMIQFWRPAKTTAGSNVLCCLDSPCAYSTRNSRLGKYRSRCCRYYYVIDDSIVADPMTISGAPHSSVFLNHFPEAVLDLRVHRGTPLVDFALECELTCFMLLPVFNQTLCVGVVEVSMRFPGDFVAIFNELTCELKRVGLCINPPKPLPLSCKALSCDRKLVASEIEKALQMTFQLHSITLGQVWICYENYHRKMKRTLLGKVKSVGDQLSLVKQFYDNFYLLPIRKGEGLIGSTFETHLPHFCRNMYKLTDNDHTLLTANASIKCACFMICVRNREREYLFEFFWPLSRNHLSLMKDVLLTLKEYLPSFNLASGAQLDDDELLAVDVDKSFSPIKIFTGNELSEGLLNEEKKASVGVKIKHIDLFEDDDDLVILAYYKVDYRLLFLPSSATFENVWEKIKQEFGLLNPAGKYKIEYQVVPGEWYVLTDDTCLKSCILSYQTSNDINHIKIGVLDVEK